MATLLSVDHYNFQQGATALRVAFHSDASGSGRGFRFRYKLVSDCSSYFTEVIPSNIPGAGTASCFTKVHFDPCQIFRFSQLDDLTDL